MATRAHTEAKNLWYRDSGILACEECEGKGSRWNGHGCGGNDPDSWDIDCAECEAQGYHECPVCGFGVRVGAFDCLVCDNAREIPEALRTDDTADQIGKAFARAFIKIKHHHERVAQAEQAEARPALSYIPARLVA